MPSGGFYGPVFSDWALGHECSHPDSSVSEREPTPEEMAAWRKMEDERQQRESARKARNAARVAAAYVRLNGFVFPLAGEDDLLAGRKLVGSLYIQGLPQMDMALRRPPKGRAARYPQIAGVERLDGGMVGGSYLLQEPVYRFASDPDDEPFLPLVEFRERSLFIQKRQALEIHPDLLEA